MSAHQIFDQQIFDKQEFIKNIRKSNNHIPLYKAALSHGHLQLNEAFDAGISVKDLVYERAWFIDQILKLAWQEFITAGSPALVAVGGYGRGELHPRSDIDLMILQTTIRNKDSNKELEKFLTFLWDIGLEVGHSVRTVRDCVREARADITIATNIMESRLLAGNKDLYQDMVRKTGPDKIWKSKKFFTAKLKEQIERHHKFNDTEYNLEPNLKEGPGGLRDIQMIGWVAKRHFGGDTLRDLVKYKFLTNKEFLVLDNGQTILWQIRYALHKLTGRDEDRILFGYQHEIAEMLGFHEKGNKGIEKFMKMYYQTVMELARLNEMLLQHFQEVIILGNKREKIIPINKRFNIRNKFIEVSNDRIFKRYPFALLELFLLIQQNPVIKGVRASTIRLGRQYTYLINENFRKDIRNRSLFMEIIRQSRYVGHELRRMHRYGVLGEYLPSFAMIEGLMQFDLFHVYTVDEHILFVIKNMRLYGTPEYRDSYPLCYEVINKLPKLELLYLAGMFHDIAKGRGGDHSYLGAQDAYDFCKLHDLSEYDSKLVAWLVEHHLVLSKTAQREDINDPDTIYRFATIIGDQLHLNYLYAMTVADINATNPTLWNDWKAVLFSDLYHKTLLALRRGLENPIEKRHWIDETRKQAAKLIRKYTDNRHTIDEFWNSLDDDYFIRHSAEEISWHTGMIIKNRDPDIPLVDIREAPTRGGTGIFVYMKDRDYIFATTTQELGLLGLNIVDARIITTSDGYTLDTYIVLEDKGEKIRGRERRSEINNRLRDALSSPKFKIKKFTRRKSSKLQHFPIPTRVSFSEDKTNNRTIMEVSGADRPGFLSQVATAMAFCGVRLEGAKIATYGTRVEDIFFITDKNNYMIKEDLKFECLENSIIEALDS